MRRRGMSHRRSPLRPGLLAAAVALEVLLAGTASAASSSWASVGDMPRTQQDHESITLADGRVLIVGRGTEMDLFDPATGAFSTTGAARFSHGNGMRAIRLLDGRVLVAGGDEASGKAETYDPALGTFTETAGEMVYPHAYHTLTLLADGRVLVGGGRSGSPSKLLP